MRFLIIISNFLLCKFFRSGVQIDSFLRQVLNSKFNNDLNSFITTELDYLANRGMSFKAWMVLRFSLAIWMCNLNFFNFLDQLSTYVNSSEKTSKISSLEYALLHFNVSRSISNFTGREADLRKLIDSLKQEFCLTVVSGMGGVGKTCLVRHFVNRKKLEDWNILWLATETEDDLKQSLIEAAKCVSERLRGMWGNDFT